MVFKNQDAGAVINKLFVNFKLNGNKDAGAADFRKQYAVRGYPTVLILKNDGTEIDRIVGFGGDRDAYVKTLQNYAAGIGTLPALKAEFDKDPTDLAAVYNLAKKYVDRYELAEAKPYYEKLLELDPKDTTGHDVEARFYVALGTIRESGDSGPLEAFLAQHSDERYVEQGYRTLIRYYQKNKEMEKVVSTYETLLKKVPESAGLLNSYAWTIYEEKLSSHYERGIELAKRAVQLKADPGILDTLAWLYAANGQKAEAIATMEKAVAAAPDDDSYKQSLAKIKAGEK